MYTGGHFPEEICHSTPSRWEDLRIHIWPKGTSYGGTLESPTRKVARILTPGVARWFAEGRHMLREAYSGEYTCGGY